MPDEKKPSAEDQKLTRTMLAYLEERDLLLGVVKDALDFMVMAEQWWMSQRENGENAPVTVIAKGKLFMAINTFRQKELKRQLIDVKTRIEKEATPSHRGNRKPVRT